MEQCFGLSGKFRNGTGDDWRADEHGSGQCRQDLEVQIKIF